MRTTLSRATLKSLPLLVGACLPRVVLLKAALICRRRYRLSACSGRHGSVAVNIAASEGRSRQCENDSNCGRCKFVFNRIGFPNCANEALFFLRLIQRLPRRLPAQAAKRAQISRRPLVVIRSRVAVPVASRKRMAMHT